MNTAAQYFYLLRWLVFPSILLSIVTLLPIVGGGVSLWLYFTDQAQLGKLFYSLSIIIYTLILFSFLAQFPLLCARKTFILTGVLAWRLTVIGFVLISLWSLAVAPIMLGVENLASGINWLRAAILTLSFLTLLIYFGALTRLNLFFVSLVIVGISLWGGDAFTAFATAAWRHGSPATYVILLLLTLAIWLALYLRIAHARLPRALGDRLDYDGGNGRRSAVPAHNWIIRFMPRLKLGNRIQSPAAVLLLEFSRPGFAYTLMGLAGAVPLALIFLLLGGYWLPGNDVVVRVGLAITIVVAPLLILLPDVDHIAGNVRRLWLFLPGGRAELFKEIEYCLFRGLAPGMVLFLALSLFLLADQKPLWWLICWAALMPLAGLLCLYVLLLTVASDHPMVPVFRFLLLLFILPPIVVAFWFGVSPLFSIGLVTTLLVGALVARPLARQRWLRMDYSLLTNKVGRTWR